MRIYEIVFDAHTNTDMNIYIYYKVQRWISTSLVKDRDATLQMLTKRQRLEYRLRTTI